MIQLVMIMNEPELITPYAPQKLSFPQVFPSKFVNKWRKGNSFICNKPGLLKLWIARFSFGVTKQIQNKSTALIRIKSFSNPHKKIKSRPVAK